ncbi:MAG TPA: carbohydrate kinase [Terriglobales bacterium]|nr:carbohydrate kinase [Terriglobales bacterium]
MLPTGKHLGGAPLNFAYIASLLEDRAVIATRVGEDALGREIRTDLNSRNVDTSAIQSDAKLPTGTVEVQFHNGQPEYEIRKPVAWDALEWSSAWQRLARRCDAVCFGTLAQRSAESRSTILRFLERTRASCLRVFDINLRKPFYSRTVIETALPFATVLKMNHVELPQVAEMFAISGQSAAELMLAMPRKLGVKLLLVTRGEHGAAASDGSRVIEHPGFAVKVRDTIGAGDAFSAAATHCLIRGVDLEQTLAFANRWASWVASQAGGMPVLNEEGRKAMTSG